MHTDAPIITPAPPGATDAGGGGGWAWLVTARNIFEAHMIRGLLEVQGIVPVVLDTRDPSPGAWMFLAGNVNALVRILVPASLLDAARLALLEAGYASDEPASAAQQSASGWRWWVWVVVAVAMIFVYVIATLRNGIR